MDLFLVFVLRFGLGREIRLPGRRRAGGRSVSVSVPIKRIFSNRMRAGVGDGQVVFKRHPCRKKTKPVIRGWFPLVFETSMKPDREKMVYLLFKSTQLSDMDLDCG